MDVNDFGFDFSDFHVMVKAKLFYMKLSMLEFNIEFEERLDQEQNNKDKLLYELQQNSATLFSQLVSAMKKKDVKAQFEVNQRLVQLMVKSTNLLSGLVWKEKRDLSKAMKRCKDAHPLRECVESFHTYKMVTDQQKGEAEDKQAPADKNKVHYLEKEQGNNSGEVSSSGVNSGVTGS